MKFSKSDICCFPSLSDALCRTRLPPACLLDELCLPNPDPQASVLRSRTIAPINKCYSMTDSLLGDQRPEDHTHWPLSCRDPNAPLTAHTRPTGRTPPTESGFSRHGPRSIRVEHPLGPLRYPPHHHMLTFLPLSFTQRVRRNSSLTLPTFLRSFGPLFPIGQFFCDLVFSNPSNTNTDTICASPCFLFHDILASSFRVTNQSRTIFSAPNLIPRSVHSSHFGACLSTLHWSSSFKLTNGSSVPTQTGPLAVC